MESDDGLADCGGGVLDLRLCFFPVLSESLTGGESSCRGGADSFLGKILSTEAWGKSGSVFSRDCLIEFWSDS